LEITHDDGNFGTSDHENDQHNEKKSKHEVQLIEEDIVVYDNHAMPCHAIYTTEGTKERKERNRGEW
jgi:hypothetical protein